MRIEISICYVAICSPFNEFKYVELRSFLLSYAFSCKHMISWICSFSMNSNLNIQDFFSETLNGILNGIKLYKQKSVTVLRI